MSISIIDNFQINKLGPIDVRMIATNSTARNSIAYKYDGLKVFQTDNRITYTWNASASSWDDDSSGTISGTGSSGFISSWIGQSSLGNTPVYSNVTGSLSGFPVGIVGINTPPTGALAPKGSFQINAPFAGGAAPTVITKGTSTTISENWYNSGGEQVFDATKGSSLLEFNNGTLVIKTRTANNPSSTYNKLRVTNSDIEVSSYEGGTPSTGDILASVVARSLTYNANLAGIKFVADGTWGVGSFPTSTIFYSMLSDTQIRSMTIKPNGSVIIGGTSGSVSVTEKLLVEGDIRTTSGIINFGDYSTATYSRTGYIWSTSDNLQINRQTNHPINFATNNQNRVRILSTGELSPLFGIKFPATQVSSSDVNTLDDYEEGTITINSFINLYDGSASPVNILFGSAGGTSTGNIKYVKIGTSVTISGWMTLDWTAINGGTHGSRFVEFSLPFSPSGSSQGGIGVHLVCPQWTSDPSYGGNICIQSVSGNPVILKYHKPGSAVAEPTVADFKSINFGVCDLFITFTYISAT